MANDTNTPIADSTAKPAASAEFPVGYAASKAQKKINKLKKSRLWPSVVFFIVSLLIGGLLLALELGIFVSHIIETKYTSALSSAQDIASGVEGRLQAGEGPQTALDETARSLGSASQLFIISSSGEVLASIGEITIDTQYGALMRTEKGEGMFRDGSAIADAS